MLLKTRDLVTMAILLAINLISLVLATTIETNTLAFFGIASWIIYIVLEEYGLKNGLLFCIGSIIAGFFLSINKIQICTYIILLTPYVILKYKIKNMFFRIILGNGLGVIFYLLLRFVFMFSIKNIYFIIFEIGIIVFDFALKYAMIIYRNRIKPYIIK